MVVEVASRLKELVGVADGNVRKVEVLGDHVDDVWDDEARSVSPLGTRQGRDRQREGFLPIRKPSTPMFNQNFMTFQTACLTSGFSQFKSGCSVRGGRGYEDEETISAYVRREVTNLPGQK
jgi:hypothetical protein